MYAVALLDLELPGLDPVWPFGIDLPRTGRVDCLAVHLHPGSDAVQYGDFLAVERAIRLTREVQKECAILTDRIDHPVDNLTWMQIATILTVLLKKAAVVMPIADAGLRLPGIWHNLASHPALIAADEGFGQPRGHIACGDEAFHLAPMSLQIVIVEVSANVHAGPSQRKQGVIEKKLIRVMLIDQVPGAVVEILDIGDIGERVGGVFDAIKPLRIKTLPPLPLTVGAGQIAVVGNPRERTGLVRPVRRLEPPPVARLVQTDADAQPLLAGCGGPDAHHIAMRADSDGIPLVIF